MCNQRYPNTWKQVIHANNYACALAELYGPDHFKGKEAITKLENAKDYILGVLEAYSSLTWSKLEDPITRKKEEKKGPKRKLLAKSLSRGWKSITRMH